MLYLVSDLAKILFVKIKEALKNANRNIEINTIRLGIVTEVTFILKIGKLKRSIARREKVMFVTKNSLAFWN